jgi:hypothetical protein
MSDYREESNKAKAVKRGIVTPRPLHGGKKKPKVKGPWKVIGNLFDCDYIYHHCATEELAEKMLQKHGFRERFRIEYQENKAL